MTTMTTMTGSPTTDAAPHEADRADDELAARIRFGVTRLARLLRQQSDAGLSPTQLAALATISRCGPMPIGLLAEQEQVAAPTATKAVEKLVAAGLVDRVPDPGDRRVKRVAASAHGEEVLAAIRARKTAWLSTRLADLPEADLAALAAAVEVLERLAAPPTSAPPTPASPTPPQLPETTITPTTPAPSSR